jgi:hypothetical protein
MALFGAVSSRIAPAVSIRWLLGKLQRFNKVCELIRREIELIRSVAAVYPPNPSPVKTARTPKHVQSQFAPAHRWTRPSHTH